VPPLLRCLSYDSHTETEPGILENRLALASASASAWAADDFPARASWANPQRDRNSTRRGPLGTSAPQPVHALTISPVFATRPGEHECSGPSRLQRRDAALINYDGRRFRGVENSQEGEVSGKTVFEYRQVDDVVWGTYTGGTIRFGTIVAKVAPDASLDMRYQHVNDTGVLCTGQCHSRAEVLPDGRIRLHESWRWTSGRNGAGESIVEELR